MDLGADWLGACRRATAGLRDLLGERPTTRERVRETGDIGEGGDRTLIIDADAEAIVFAELDRLHAGGARFTAVSEERGEVAYGGDGLIVIVDPIDGSMNAKRGLPHHSLSIAVADGPTMADVVFGFVHDFGPGEEWTAVRGQGAWLDGVLLATDVPERRTPDGKLELLGIESADPRWIDEFSAGLAAAAHRVRALGTIAVTLCQVAGARLDGMLTLKDCRAVDAAAGQLIVREAGGVAGFVAFEDPLSAPLDMAPHSPLVAARTPAALADIASIYG